MLERITDAMLAGKIIVTIVAVHPIEHIPSVMGDERELENLALAPPGLRSQA